MKKDIENRDDIVLLVDYFYKKVNSDERLAYLFNSVAKVNWEKHMPVMYDFWDNVLFFRGNYMGQPMNLHQHLHKVSPINLVDFKIWNTLFDEAVNELFEGPNAETAKQKAHSISTVMQIKILNSYNPL
jgi:hemoglobin